MFPVLFSAGSLKVNSYGFFIAVGYLSALALGYHLARARDLRAAFFMDLGFVAIVSGVVGARAMFIVTAPAHFQAHPWEAAYFWTGGLVFYGGFLAAAGVCLLYARWKRLPIPLAADIVCTGVALGHAFGRIGCFAAGCCYGSTCPYPWAVRMGSSFAIPPLRDHPIHPVQLYESAALFGLAAIMAWMVKDKRLVDGSVAAVYLVGYATIRFLTEMFRGDSDRGFVASGLLSTSQAIAILLFALGFGILIRGFRRKHL